MAFADCDSNSIQLSETSGVARNSKIKPSSHSTMGHRPLRNSNSGRVPALPSRVNSHQHIGSSTIDKTNSCPIQTFPLISPSALDTSSIRLNQSSYPVVNNPATQHPTESRACDRPVSPMVMEPSNFLGPSQINAASIAALMHLKQRFTCDQLMQLSPSYASTPLIHNSTQNSYLASALEFLQSSSMKLSAMDFLSPQLPLFTSSTVPSISHAPSGLADLSQPHSSSCSNSSSVEENEILPEMEGKMEHGRKRAFKCDGCSKYFATAHGLEVHVRR